MNTLAKYAPYLLLCVAFALWLFVGVKRKGPFVVRSYLGGKLISEVVYTNASDYVQPERYTWEQYNCNLLLLQTFTNKGVPPSGGAAR